MPRQVLFSYQHYLQLCHNRTSCRRPPIGLTNHGNNCYANSALQCLLASRPLRAYLDQGLHSRDCNKPGNEWCLLCQLQVCVAIIAKGSSGLHSDMQESSGSSSTGRASSVGLAAAKQAASGAVWWAVMCIP